MTFLGLGVESILLTDAYNKNEWSRLCDEISRIIKSRTLEYWLKRFEGLDACVTPVLNIDNGEAMRDVHNFQR